MDVVRATTATRVNELGLIEVVPRNLLTYSNDFSNAAWIMFAGPPVTPNSIISPDGLTNGTTLNSAGGSNDFLYQVITTTIGVTYTNSFYIKNLNSTQSQYLDANGIPTIINWSGPILTSIIGIGSSFVSVGNGWYRVFTTVTAANTTYVYRMYADINNTSKSVYIYGAQLEQGSLTEYFPTTTRLNIPRLDYSNGSCPSLLVEPQRTNLLTYSNDFTNASWTKLNASITQNAIISSDGTLNASKLVENNLTAEHQIIKDNGYFIGSQSFSFYAKAGERNQINLSTEDFGGTSWILNGNGSTIKGGATTVSIKLVTNNWYLCNCTFTSTQPFQFYIKLNNGSGTNYLGNGTSGLYIYGFQSEVGSYPTSYIPTSASTVTRNADVISKTNSFIANKTVACLFIDLNRYYYASDFVGILGYRNGTTCDFYMLQYQNSDVIEFRAKSANGVQNSINLNVPLGHSKIAMYRENDKLSIFINGIKIIEQTSVSPMNEFLNSPQLLRINTDPFFGTYDAQLFINSAQI
jgi:hypothetical protein